MLKLTYSNLEFQNFSGRTGPSLQEEGREEEWRGGEGGEREGKDGKGQGSEGGREGRNGGGGEGG